MVWTITIFQSAVGIVGMKYVKSIVFCHYTGDNQGQGYKNFPHDISSNCRKSMKDSREFFLNLIMLKSVITAIIIVSTGGHFQKS
jgi:hypothetical protein